VSSAATPTQTQQHRQDWFEEDESKLASSGHFKLATRHARIVHQRADRSVFVSAVVGSHYISLFRVGWGSRLDFPARHLLSTMLVDIS
jgi:hypothetical protein